ncbi:MAG: class I SAM-dependent methyltransferase, partial [Anaerolineae bacterium]
MEIYRAAREDILASQHGDPLLRHLTRVVVDLAEGYSPPEVGSAVDVGCGVGRTSLALARVGYRVTGLDPSPRAISLAEEAAASCGLAARARFYLGDAAAGPPAEWAEAFQLAVCSEVLEHVPEPEAVVDYCRRVLVPGGSLIVT